MVARVLVAAMVCLAACYDVPTPACGFVCGRGAACPDGYACNTKDAVCHRIGDPNAMFCPGTGPGFDETPPEVVGFAANSSGAFVDFSEEVTMVTDRSFMVLRSDTNEEVPGSIFASTFSAMFSPDQILPPGEYRAVLSDDIEDLEGNRLVPFEEAFTILTDMTAPQVNFQMPGPGESGVPVDTVVSVFFNEAVVNLSASSVRIEQAGSLIAAQLEVTNSSATLTPQLQLVGNTVYNVVLNSEITDLFNNPLQPIVYTFMTGPDTVPPSARKLEPTSSFQVPLDAMFAYQFDEPVLGVDATTFFLVRNATVIAATVTYDAAMRIARLDPDALLEPDAEYSVLLAPTISDVAGNTFVGKTRVVRTPDTLPPTLTTSTPASADVQVATSSTITVTFNESVQGVNVTSFLVTSGGVSIPAAAIAQSNSAKTFELTPASPLPASATITVTLTPAIKDLATPANALPAPLTFSFTTAP